MSTNKIILGVVVIAALYVGFTYNSLVKANLAVDGGWAQVENQFQRRFDLIPNLVSSVSGAMKQETAVFSNITEARTRYSGAMTVQEKVAAANQVESAIGRLLVVMENYPTIKSIDTVTSLMGALEGTENRVAVERQRFNELTQAYDVKVKVFPSSLVAKMFGFGEREFFKAMEEAKVAPKVNL